MQTNSFRQAPRGFTLTELMIVVAIIAILGAIAVPSYLKYVQQARRSDAVSALTQDQAILERCYATSFDYYNVTTGANGCGTVTLAATPSPQGYYNVVLDTPAPASTANGYTLVAAPAPGSPQLSDAPCASFQLTSGNVRTATGTGSPNSTCWQQ